MSEETRRNLEAVRSLFPAKGLSVLWSVGAAAGVGGDEFGSGDP